MFSNVFDFNQHYSLMHILRFTLCISVWDELTSPCPKRSLVYYLRPGPYFGFTIRNRPGCHLGLIFYKEVRNVLHVLIWIDPSVPNQQSCVCLFRNQSIDYSLLLNTWTRLNTSISFWHHFLFLGEKINNYCCDVLGGGSTPCGYWLFYWTQQNSGCRCNVLFIWVFFLLFGSCKYVKSLNGLL